MDLMLTNLSITNNHQTIGYVFTHKSLYVGYSNKSVQHKSKIYIYTSVNKNSDCSAPSAYGINQESFLIVMMDCLAYQSTTNHATSCMTSETPCCTQRFFYSLQ